MILVATQTEMTNLANLLIQKYKDQFSMSNSCCCDIVLITENTQSINLLGYGNTAAPLKANIIISPDASNALSIRPNGLYATAGGGSGTLTGADTGLSVVANVAKFGEPLGSVTHPALVSSNRQIPILNNTKIRITGPPYGNPGKGASSALTIDLDDPGTSNDPGKVSLDSQSFSGIGFKYIGADPGFVRNQVDQTYNPTDALTFLPYELASVGETFRNIYENTITQLYLGVLGNVFANKSFMIRTTSDSISLAVDNNGFINFRGSAFHNTSEYGRFAATTGYLGLGTPTPSERLHIVGKPKFVTGAQGAGKVLVSDASGVGDWVTITTTTPTLDQVFLVESRTAVMAANNIVNLSGNDFTFNGFGHFKVTNRITFDITSNPLTIIGLTNLTTGDRLIGQVASSNVTGYITIGTGLSLSSGVLSNSGVITTPTWEQTLTAQGATAFVSGHTVDFDANLQAWRWNAITTATGLNITSTSLTTGQLVQMNVQTTAATGSASRVLNVAAGGTNAASSVTTYGIVVANTHDGTTSTSIGIMTGASGATNNYGLIVNNGTTGLLTTTPTASALHIAIPTTTAITTASGIYEAMNSLTTGTGHYILSTSATSGALLDLSISGTAAVGNGSPTTTQSGIRVSLDGANAGSGVVSFAQYISNSHTGTTSSNYGLYNTVTGGATTNVAAYLQASGTTSSNLGADVSASGVATNNYAIRLSATGGTNNYALLSTAGNISVTNGNTTQVTTASAISLNVNSLTTGTGLYAVSSTLTSGKMIDVAITGTAGLTNQTGINISLSGANATGAQTTYGIQISNTHTGTSVNVGMFITTTGGSSNFPLRLVDGTEGNGKILTSDANGNANWAVAAITWNGISNPTADQALTFAAGFSSTWTNSNTTEDLFTINSSTITTSSLLSLNSTSTALAAGNNLAEFVMSGANTSNAITATGIRVSVTNTNATSGTNIAATLAASGATTANIALQTTAGNVLIGAPTNNTVDALIIQSPNNTIGNGLRIYANNNSTYTQIGYSGILNPGGFSIQSSSVTTINLSGGLTFIGGSTTPTSTLHIGGSLAGAYIAKTANYTVTVNEYVTNCTSGTFTVTLPTAVGITGRIYIVKNSGAGTITIATTSSQTIDGVTTKTLSVQYSTMAMMSDGANWIIISTF